MSRLPFTAMAALCAGLVVSMCLGSAAAHASATDEAERARLSQERASLESTYSARLAECQERFVVTPCVDDAKRDRRQGLDALRARQIVVDETRRKERSEARRSELSANAAEQARRDSERAKRPAAVASGPSRDEPGRALEPRRPSVRNAAASKRRLQADEGAASVRTRAEAADRAAKEGRSRATFEARRQQAAEHRSEVADKASKRNAHRPPATMLPLPNDVRPAP